MISSFEVQYSTFFGAGLVFHGQHHGFGWPFAKQILVCPWESPFGGRVREQSNSFFGAEESNCPEGVFWVRASAFASLCSVRATQKCFVDVKATPQGKGARRICTDHRKDRST
jgi:hypothetical protein